MVIVTSTFALPAKTTKARAAMAAAGVLGKASKPDVDNLVKSALDGAQLNPEVLKDDGQVVAAVGINLSSRAEVLRNCKEIN